MKTLVLHILFIASRACGEDSEFPRVKVSNGVLKGKVVRSATGEEVNAFLGIPYAEPPVGNLRFKKPVPFQTEFKTEYDATKLSNLCPQRVPQLFNTLTRSYIRMEPDRPTSEDCLYLHVWVPKLPGELRNVIFVINDNSLTGIDWFTGETLAAESNSIVVSCQHRVGAFGFFYLGTEDAPGNQGLLDQNLALQWVRKNIAFFGGNPDQVTLFGTDSSGGSVSYHLLSPLSQPLFSRAVLSSGAATSYWWFQSQIKAKEQALEIIEAANCSKNEVTAVDCLRKIDYSILIHLEFHTRFANDGFEMVPTIDSYFINDTPRNLLQSRLFKPKEILIGNVVNFYTFITPIVFDYVFAPFTSSNATNERLLSLFRNTTREYREKQGKAIAFDDYNLVFAGDGLLSPRFMLDVTIMSHIICPTMEFGNLYNASGAAVYHYYFGEEFEHDRDLNGVFIGDEGAYFFGKPLNQSLPYRNASREISVKMMRVLSEFSKTGVPFQGWRGHKPVGIFQIQILNSSDTTYKFGPSNGQMSGECNFLNEVVKEL